MSSKHGRLAIGMADLPTLEMAWTALLLVGLVPIKGIFFPGTHPVFPPGPDLIADRLYPDQL